MSNAIYPSLKGLTWDCEKTFSFKTRTLPSENANEVRIATQSYSRMLWKISYEYLLENSTNNPNSGTDFSTLASFMQARNGNFDSFLLDDVIAEPPDNYVSAQFIATGDAATTVFQLQRTMGAYTQPVSEVNTSDGTKPFKVYLNGVLQGSGYSITLGNGGKLTFSVAPGNGVAISVDMKYYWRVRFNNGDSSPFKIMMAGVWDNMDVELIQVYQ